MLTVTIMMECFIEEMLTKLCMAMIAKNGTHNLLISLILARTKTIISAVTLTGRTGPGVTPLIQARDGISVL